MPRSHLSSLLVAMIACSVIPARPAHAQCEVQALRAPAPSGMQAFGSALDLAGERLLVGAPRAVVEGEQRGAAYVYARDATGWRRQQVLGDPEGYEPAFFGNVLTLTADTAFVASPLWGPAVSGRVLVYKHDGTRFRLAQALANGDATGFDIFGVSLAADGDRLLVGALGREAVYVFERAGGSWNEANVLQPFGPPALSTYFGGVVALDGDRAIVGTGSTSSSHPGAVFTFSRSAAGWSAGQVLVPSDGHPGDAFGMAIAVQGELAIVGAPRADGARPDTGAVYVYERRPGGWIEAARLATSDGLLLDRFGAAVAIAGERILVGAPGADGGAGAAWLYERSGAGWRLLSRLSARGTTAGGYGTSVALGRDELLVGAAADDTGAVDSGSVRVVSAPALASPFGSCAAGAPCGNEDRYAGCANSTSRGALLAACGSTRLGVGDLSLRAGHLPAGTAAILIGSPTRRSPQPFGDGRLTLGGAGAPLLRLAHAVADPAGELAIHPDLAGGPFTPGASWFLQLWYADPAGPCGTGGNLTSALRVTWTP